jgi:primosomal protein N' (replication factor Y)
MSTQRLKGDTPYMSFLLKQKIDQRLEADQQAILFLNRRGYSPQLKCADCGHVPACPHCEIKLTFHKTGRKLACHYCGYLSLALDTCDSCSGNDFIYPGTGTQKVEEHVSRLFERGQVLRFDSDTASGRKNAHQLLRAFADRKYNLLLGTQMVTKGLDLPGVTLVGVLSADMGIDMPDFRANEKTFARLLQVAGRSGRGMDRGEVFIQTYYPESDVIRDAARQDFESFFAREIESRRTHSFPPFMRLIRFVLASKDKARVEEHTARFTRELKERAVAHRFDIKVMGPAACPIALLRGATRKHLIVKTTKPVVFVRMLTEWESEKPRFGLPATVKISIDVDPDDMM